VVLRPIEGRRVCPSEDHLGSGAAVRCEVHLVLHRGEEALGDLCVGRVVYAGHVDVEHLLVEAPLRRADVPDAFEELVKVGDVTLRWRVL
jgi:hypothetical protein